MPGQETPYWSLISVLFSSFPLTSSLAMTLYQVALDIYQREASTGPVAGDMVSGQVRNLDTHWVLGSISGPAFEATLETDRGSGTVKFLLTKEALEQLAPRAQYLN